MGGLHEISWMLVRADATHDDRGALVEPVVVLRVQEACGVKRVVDTAVPWISEVEFAIGETWLWTGRRIITLWKDSYAICAPA